jgi:predicted transcriptional regulator
MNNRIVGQKRMTRDRNDITYQILQAVHPEPVSRTRIMYLTLLNFHQINQYLSLMEAGGLVRSHSTEKKYGITERGRQALELYDKSFWLLSPEPIKPSTAKHDLL